MMAGDIIRVLLEFATALALLFGGFFFKRLLSTLDKLSTKVAEIHTEISVQQEASRFLEQRISKIEERQSA